MIHKFYAFKIEEESSTWICNHLPEILYQYIYDFDIQKKGAKFEEENKTKLGLGVASLFNQIAN